MPSGLTLYTNTFFLIMKTIKFKLHLTDVQIRTFDETCLAASKVWNQCHSVAMHNRSVEWWQWASKVSKKDKTWSLDDATMTQIKLGKNNAYVGAYCEINRCKGYWAKDETQPMIEYRGKKIPREKIERIKPSEIYWQDGESFEMMRKYPKTKWVGDPIESAEYIGNREFKPMATPTLLGGGKPITKVNQLDNAGLLKLLGIDLPAGITDYVGGVIKQFETSYAAWLDTKRQASHKPQWRDLTDRGDWCGSLYNAQSPPKNFERTANGDMVTLAKVFGSIRLYDGEMDRIPVGMIARSYIMKVDASGYYLCVTYATPAEVAKVQVNTRKPPQGLSDAEKIVFNEQKKADKLTAESAIRAESYNPGNGKTLGIDPGVKRQITAHDGEKTFHIKLSKDRQRKRSLLYHKTNDLKRKLSKKKTRNNLRYGVDSDTRRSAGTLIVEGVKITLKTETALQHRVSRMQLLQANRRNAYQHRVSVRLFAAGYSTIKYEKTQLSNMVRRSGKRLLADGTYAKNKQSAKSGLNRSLADTAMAAQSEKIKMRFTVAGRTFIPVPAQNTSQSCHCCGVKGSRETQERFICLNTGCELFDVVQNADDNASKNMYCADPSLSKSDQPDESLE
jgi:transposase